MSTMEGRKKRRFGLHLKAYWPYYLMVLPGFVYLFIIRYIPMFGSIVP